MRQSANIGVVLSQAASRRPADVAIIDGVTGTAHTFADLHAHACAVAAWLEDTGVAAGSRVGLAMPNSANIVAAWFGIVYAGATVVPISTRAAEQEVQVRLEHAGATRHLTELPEALPEPAPETYPRTVADGRPAMILYTSGTTGEPKGACIGHASLLMHTAALVHHTVRLTPQDRVLGVLPLSHSYGCRIAMLAPFYAGATTIMLPGFSASGSLDAMREHGVTWAPAVPTMFAAWAAVDDTHPAPGQLRWCLSAGAPLSDAIREAAEARLGAEIRQGYGMTEATFSTIDDPRAPARPGTVGRPVWGVEVRVVDDEGATLPRDSVGNVQVRGPNVMLGYLDAPAATRRRIVDGWVQTGDVGVLSKDGWLTVVDREKDIILRGGFTVYPSEVEAALTAQPAVQEAAVIGLPDTFYGEVVVAVVVSSAARPDADALGAALEPLLGVDKRPSRYVFVDELPQSNSGKVLKRMLREYVTTLDAASTVRQR